MIQKNTNRRDDLIVVIVLHSNDSIVELARVTIVDQCQRPDHVSILKGRDSESNLRRFSSRECQLRAEESNWQTRYL